MWRDFTPLQCDVYGVNRCPMRRNPMKESDVEKIDDWVLEHIDEEKYLVEDYDEVSRTRLDVWTLDNKGRNVVFKLEVKSGKVNLIGKEVVRE
jgi:hypothetical protein